MKANSDKCHFICSTNDTVNLIVENQIVELMKFDFKLTFHANIDGICKKAELKLNALSRIAPYMDFNKKRLLLNVSIQLFSFDGICHNPTKIIK